MAVQAPPASLSSEGGTPSETQSEATELPLDVIFEVLSNRRRRFVLRYLLSEAGTTTLGELAEHIASIENEKPERELSSTERKRVYICLYQCHLPKMDDADVIEFDENRKTVEVGENIEHLTAYLPEGNGVDSGGKDEGLTRVITGFTSTFDRRLRSLTGR